MFTPEVLRCNSFSCSISDPVSHFRYPLATKCRRGKKNNADGPFISAPEGGDIVLDLINVVLRDALVFGLALLLRHVASHQVPHDSLTK